MFDCVPFFDIITPTKNNACQFLPTVNGENMIKLQRDRNGANLYLTGGKIV